MKIALNMIAGPGTSAELDRCLQSLNLATAGIGGAFIDGVVITLTTRDDAALSAVARKYCDPIFFDWCDDFSAVRNFCLDNTPKNFDHIFWLDSDDIVKPSEYQKLLEFKQGFNQQFDVIMMQYNYVHDLSDSVLMTLPRERLWRIDTGIRWFDPVHEYLNISGKIYKIDIAIDHYQKNSEQSNQRNIRIYEKMDENVLRPRSLFYYAKEISFVSDEKSHELYVRFVKNPDTSDNACLAYQKLALYEYNHKNYDECIRLCNEAIKHSIQYAETYYILATAYERLGNKHMAESNYKICLLKEYGNAGMSQLAPYYRILPLWRLIISAIRRDDLQIALTYISELGSNAPEALKYLQTCLRPLA